MPDQMKIKLGRSTAHFSRSETLVAMKPQPGRSTSFDAEVMSIEVRGHGVRRGRVAGFDLIELPHSAQKRQTANEELGRTISAQRQVPVYHTSDDGVPFVPTGTIYMSFADNVDRDKAEALLRRYSLVMLRAERDGFLTVGTQADPLELCVELQAESVVAVAEPDLATPKQAANLLPGDSLFGKHWHLNNTGRHGGCAFGYKAGADARVVEAWYALSSLGSDAVIIGIVDDGFDLRHPDLQGKAVLSRDLFRNPSEPLPGEPTSGARDWHGTACASIAAGKAAGGDIVGAAPNARIMPVQMGPDIDTEGLARIFEFMATNGAWVVNCSWGPKAARYPLGERLANAISYCVREGRNGLGTPVLFAAGNENTSINGDGRLNGLATHPDVMAISSSTSLDERSATSNFGTALSLCAPSSGGGGWAIVTSDVTGNWTDSNGVTRPRGGSASDYYEQFGGTSSSCALVAGVCALVYSAAPGLRARELRAILERTARRIGDPSAYGPNGHSVHFGFGCVDAAAAIAAARAYLTS